MSNIKYIKLFIILISASIAIASSSFITKKDNAKEYGLIKVAKINSKQYHYTVIDLAVLDGLKAEYGCETNGNYCQVNVRISNATKIKRSGLHGEIIEFDSDLFDEAKMSGKGFKFFYTYN